MITTIILTTLAFMTGAALVQFIHEEAASRMRLERAEAERRERSR